MGKTDPSGTGQGDKARTERADKLDFTPGSGRFMELFKQGLRGALSAVVRLNSDSVNSGSEKFLLAISGGPDSTALLLAAERLAKEQEIDLHLCHINHQLRGPESDSDERFCAELAYRLNLPLTIRHMSEYCSIPSGHAAEELLRSARYALLSHTASTVGASFILTGHTLDDQIETMLFRLFRGTGPGGLLGMDIARPIDETIFLLRPLLSLSRADCQEFLVQADQAAVFDSSNQSMDYTRNFIRLQIMPLVRNRFPGFEERLQNLRTILEEDERLLNQLTNEAQSRLESDAGCTSDRWKTRQFLALPGALRLRLLAAAMRQREIGFSFQRIQSALFTLTNGGALTLNGSWDVRADAEFIDWVKGLRESAAVKLEPSTAVAVRLPGLTIAPIFGCALRAELWPDCDSVNQFPDRASAEALVDLASVKLPLEIRRRRGGDRIRPFGMDNPVRLKKFLHNLKSEQSWRKSALVLADQDEVLWIPGIGLSNKVRVNNKPSHRLFWLDIAQDEGELC
jgi:tRNA(Ile)-lysidine synthase